MYYSMNFIWLGLLSHQKFDNRILFKHFVSFTAILNCLKTNIFVRLKYFCYKPIPNNAEITFMKKNSKKI